MITKTEQYGYSYNPVNNISFTSAKIDLYAKAWADPTAKNTITELIGEYFKGTSPGAFNTFTGLIHGNVRGNRDAFHGVREFLHGRHDDLKIIQSNADSLMEERAKFLGNLLGQAKDVIGINPGSSLIDIGSGDGRLTQRLADDLNVRKVIGVELHSMPEHAKRPFETLIYDGNNLSAVTGQNKYNVCSLISVLHHAENPQELLIQTRKVLPDNGVLIMQEHFNETSSDELFHLFGDKFENAATGRNSRETNNFLSHEALDRMLGTAGFKIVKTVKPHASVHNPFKRALIIARKSPAVPYNCLRGQVF